MPIWRQLSCIRPWPPRFLLAFPVPQKRERLTSVNGRKGAKAPTPKKIFLRASAYYKTTCEYIHNYVPARFVVAIAFSINVDINTSVVIGREAELGSQAKFSPGRIVEKGGGRRLCGSNAYEFAGLEPARPHHLADARGEASGAIPQPHSPPAASVTMSCSSQPSAKGSKLAGCCSPTIRPAGCGGELAMWCAMRSPPAGEKDLRNMKLSPTNFPPYSPPG